MVSRAHEIISHSPEETHQLAFELAGTLAPGDIISLSGNLGVGKTKFVQGLANGLGFNEAVTSPSFTIIKEYRAAGRPGAESFGRAGPSMATSSMGRLDLFHYDLYRLHYVEELFDLGYEEHLYGSGVTVIEWGQKMADLLPETILEINIAFHERRDWRLFKVLAKGDRWVGAVRGWLGSRS
ncbi:MAG: tRNA (adenosine(37)-N6)-threonylcarbamoyltransferase complex ATPase subunit type 1 TsaE [Terriglobia bacterium]